MQGWTAAAGTADPTGFELRLVSSLTHRPSSGLKHVRSTLMYSLAFQLVDLFRRACFRPGCSIDVVRSI